MFLQAILGMLTDPCTTGQLEAYINRRLWGRGAVTLEERPEGLFWMEEPVPVRHVPVYLAAEDKRWEAPAVWSDDCDDFGREPEAKQVWLPHYCLYRSPQTEEKWRSPCVYGYVTLCREAPWAELLYLDEEGSYLERFELTEDPLAEDPAMQEFEYYKHLNVLTITGVRHYCERLHIPAWLDGHPVAKVQLPGCLRLRHLRELVVEEGVQILDCSFPFAELERIDIPPSVTLARSPDCIRSTAWFKNRPEGPVYFHNYYCGTKGRPDGDALILREGTVGVIRWADEQQNWKRISLPATLTHIASGAFNTGRSLENVDFQKGTEQLKRYFTHLYPFCKDERIKTLEMRSGIPVSGKELYDLGRYHIAIADRIPRGWLPSAPRLRYENGWIAEYWYCAEDRHDVGYYAAFRLPSGEPVEVKKLSKHAHSTFQSCWTDDYLPPEYRMAEDYLNCCAVILRSGAPTKELLDQLGDWWIRLASRRVLEWTEDKKAATGGAE